MIDYIERRLKKVRTRLRKQHLDAFLISDILNVRYLSGFTGDDSWLLVAEDHAALLTDSRYTEQAQAECRHCRVVQRSRSLHETCLEFLKRCHLEQVGFEADSLTYAAWQDLQDEAVRWQPTRGIVEDLRRKKDRQEMKKIRQAVAAAEECFRAVAPGVRPGVTEAEVANEIEVTLRRLGAEGSSFETIVLFGERTSLPHGRPGNRVLKPGEPVLIDWGARVGQYVSDLTRMLLPSTMSTKLKRVYRAVLAAQQATSSPAIRSGGRGSISASPTGLATAWACTFTKGPPSRSIAATSYALEWC